MCTYFIPRAISGAASQSMDAGQLPPDAARMSASAKTGANNILMAEHLCVKGYS